MHPVRASRGPAGVGSGADARDRGRRADGRGPTRDGRPRRRSGGRGGGNPLAESNRLDAAVGTLLHLGDCYAATGKTASAWSAFRSAASLAATKNQTQRADIAKQKAAALEPTLSRLAIDVAQDARVAELEVLCDGVALGSASWGVAVPVDPGAHVIVARAPGKAAWTQTVEVAAGGGTQRVTVPALANVNGAASASERAADRPPSPGASASERAADRPPSPVDREPSHWGALRIAGLGAIGLGAAGLVVGTVYGLKRNSRQDDAKAHCLDYPNGCDASGLAANEDAASAGKIAVAGFVAGGVLSAAGVVLLLIPLSNPDAHARAELAPLMGRRGGGLQVQGTW